ncbi:TIGR00730 family Rossman fold protein [Ferruginibacter yonginensis]|uniref:Cytokinin riboside 5'-monophosphate phosphoribohydrolase n=1 Tax=Ferruginibacter yonginensis TaxID=1310416 RepID=A0ABV8QR41_9BACT
MSYKAIAVFCGSKVGNNPLYEAHTIALGQLLAEKNIRVIYGGGNKGLMGAVANAALANNGVVTGIIPELLKDREHLHGALSETFVVDGMHSRKKMLYEKCDAAIILPGGYGTLDEVFEMLTWNQLNIHSKKIFILNTAGFYDHLMAHVTKMYDDGFLYTHPIEQLTIINHPDDLRQYF